MEGKFHRYCGLGQEQTFYYILSIYLHSATYKTFIFILQDILHDKVKSI